MAIVTKQTQAGYYITCTGGTGVPVNIGGVAPDQSVRIVGISAGGANTADIVTVQDGEGNYIWGGACGTIGATISLPLGGTIRAQGLQVGFQGATTGFCMIYIPSGNS